MTPTPFTTSINGKPAAWTQAIVQKWDALVASWPPDANLTIVSVNYFTPRPYVDQYNRGSREEGFTYTVRRLPLSYVNGPSVCQSIIRRHIRIGGDAEVKP